MVAQLLIRFKVKDLAEMVDTQGFHNRTVIKKTTEYLDIDYNQTEYDYYPTLFINVEIKSLLFISKRMAHVFKINI